MVDDCTTTADAAFEITAPLNVVPWPDESVALPITTAPDMLVAVMVLPPAVMTAIGSAAETEEAVCPLAA